MKKENITIEANYSNIGVNILLIILGILMTFIPVETQVILVYMISILAIFSGVNSIIRYCRGLDGDFAFISDLLFGILLVFAGIYIFCNPGYTIFTLPMVSGVFLIVDAIIKIPMYIRYHKLIKVPLWIMIISIILPILLGITLIFLPIVTTTIIIYVTGIFLIVIGIVDIISIIYMHYKIKKANAR